VHDSENFLRAISEGQPIVYHARRSSAAGSFARGWPVAAGNDVDGAPRPQKKGRLLLGR
jgi:hypothetical protein